MRALSDDSTLTAQMGQYSPSSRQHRLYDNLQVDLYYSTSADRQGPRFTVVDGLFNPVSKKVDVKAGAIDASGSKQ